jgi:DNA-binding beta-propeller fold protein YncE
LFFWNIIVGASGSAYNQLNTPYGLALNPSSNELYISDNGNQRIMSYASGANNGTLVFGGSQGLSNTQLDYARGLYFDSFSNSFAIANANANNIVRYVLGASSWTLLAGNINGTAGATSTSFSSPNEVTLDPMGNIYVADRFNNRIQFFYANQSNGTTIAGISGVSGNNITTLNKPRSVRLDNQLNLYVADGNNNRIQKFLRY